MSQLPDIIDPDAPIFSVSVAAQLADMHAQTLRAYDRIGLVVPRRAANGRRKYSPNDVTKLRLVQRLSQDEGINLNGIRRIIQLGDQIEVLQRRNNQLTELIDELVSQDVRPRVFTASASGSVYTGRVHRKLLAISS